MGSQLRPPLPICRCRKRVHRRGLETGSQSRDRKSLGSNISAKVLLDLVKAFERIPHRVLRREADRLGYPLRLLRLAIAVYKMPRI